MRILLTGSSGYLGTALLNAILTARPDWDLHITLFSIVPADDMPNAHHLDVRDPDSVKHVMDRAQPDIILHTAALNRSDDAHDLYVTNALGSDLVAREAAKRGARLVHISTDVVFDGQRGHYREDDAPNPITPYAVSKADAEKNVLASGANAVLVRTSLLYGFRPLDPRTRSILRGEMRRLYTDELRCPIWVQNLSDAVIELAEMDYRGILNVAGPQSLSRYEFGMKLMDALGGDTSQLIADKSAQGATIRPLDCTLDISRAQRLLKTKLLAVDEVTALHKKK